jgi:lipopolysaccharide export system permease protein
MANMESHLVTHEKIQEQPTSTLISCMKSILFKIKKIESIECKERRNIYKELFKRIIKPFYLPVLILISLLLILTSKESLRYNKNKYSIFFIGFGVIILSESLLGYITNNLLKNILILILPIIIMLITYFIFIYKLKLSNKKIMR